MALRTYECESCARRFYFYGRIADALHELVVIKCTLGQGGYHNVPSAWQIVQDNAKCCDNPQLALFDQE